MFSWFVKKNTANYYNNEKNQLLKLVDKNIETFQDIINSHNTKNIKTVTRKFNEAHGNNIEILRRIGALKIQFRKTIGALPIVSTLPNSVKPYITISNNKYRFTNFPKIKQMSKILSNLAAEKGKNVKARTNAAVAEKARTNAAVAEKARTNAVSAEKARMNAAAAEKARTNAVAAVSMNNLKKSSVAELTQSQNFKKELNNSAVINTVRQQLGTNGSGVIPPKNTTKNNNLSGLN